MARLFSHRFAPRRMPWSTLLLRVAMICALACIARIVAVTQDDSQRVDANHDADDHTTHHRDWPMIGHDAADTRSQPFEHVIGPSNAHLLATKWTAANRDLETRSQAVVMPRENLRRLSS